jgi:hypothetical protein
MLVRQARITELTFGGGRWPDRFLNPGITVLAYDRFPRNTAFLEQNMQWKNGSCNAV